MNQSPEAIALLDGAPVPVEMYWWQSGDRYLARFTAEGKPMQLVTEWIYVVETPAGNEHEPYPRQRQENLDALDITIFWEWSSQLDQWRLRPIVGEPGYRLALPPNLTLSAQLHQSSPEIDLLFDFDRHQVTWLDFNYEPCLYGI